MKRENKRLREEREILKEAAAWFTRETEGVKKNEDGSYTLYFGPVAPKGYENNWLETIPDKGWFVGFRMYGPEQAWIDKTWRPGELELVK